MTGFSDPSAAPITGKIVGNLQRKCCQGPPAILVELLQRQQEASVLAKNKMVVVSHPYPLLALSRSMPLFLFPGMNQGLYANVGGTEIYTVS